jgi:hypothetical protein
LLVVELAGKLICQVEFLRAVVRKLLGDERVFVDVVPVVTYARHVNEVGQTAAKVVEMFVEKEETVIVHIGVGRVIYVESVEVVTNVIAKVGFKFIPKSFWYRWFTVPHNHGEKLAESIARADHRCFFKTLSPFVVVLEKASCKASVVERWMLNAVESA